MMNEALDRAFNELMWKRAEAHEDALRDVARSYLPRALRWLVDHPRLLKAAYQLRRRWQPVVHVGADLDNTVAMVQHKDGTLIVLNETIATSRAKR